MDDRDLQWRTVATLDGHSSTLFADPELARVRRVANTDPDGVVFQRDSENYCAAV